MANIETRIETVTGCVEAARLGTTLVHEHLLVRDDAVHLQFPRALTVGGIPERAIEPGGELDAAIEAAEAAVELGIGTVCDPTAPFLGRDVDFLRRVSEGTGLLIVACTGLYTYDHLPEFFANRSIDAIAEYFVADLQEGVQDTEIKAGFLKCAADEPGITANVEKVHRAIARASVRTGAPIMAHSRPASETGPRQVEIFEEEGVDPTRVQIAHCGDTADLGYLERLLSRGVYAGMDRYGLELYLSFEDRNATVLTLLERGYESQLLLSADSCGTLDWYPPEAAAESRRTGMVNDWDIRIVPERVIPELRAAGAGEKQIERMMVANPAAWLAEEVLP